MLKFQKDIINVLQYQHWFDSQNRNKAQQWFSLLPRILGVNADWEGISVLKWQIFLKMYLQVHILGQSASMQLSRSLPTNMLRQVCDSVKELCHAFL